MSSAPWIDWKKCVVSRLLINNRGSKKVLLAEKVMHHEKYVPDKSERMQRIETKYVYYIFLNLFLQLYFQRTEQI